MPHVLPGHNYAMSRERGAPGVLNKETLRSLSH